MEWLATAIDGPLVAIRALHIAATAITAGSLTFRAVVAEPALPSVPEATTLLRSQIRLIAWIGLSVAVATGVIWFEVQAAAISGLPFGEAMTSDVSWTVLNETQFGLVSKVRLVLAVIMAAGLAGDRFALARWPALGSALGFLAAIAWTGHAGSTPGEKGATQSGFCMGVAGPACDATVFSVGHRQRRDTIGNRGHQHMDSGWLNSRADRYRLWTAAGSQACCLRHYVDVRSD